MKNEMKSNLIIWSDHQFGLCGPKMIYRHFLNAEPLFSAMDRKIARVRGGNEENQNQMAVNSNRVLNIVPLI